MASIFDLVENWRKALGCDLIDTIIEITINPH